MPNNDDDESVLLSPEFKGNNLENFIPLDGPELIDIISQLNKKECELDPVPVKLLSECLPELQSILLFIVNDSIVNGVFPQSLKEALVSW